MVCLAKSIHSASLLSWWPHVLGSAAPSIIQFAQTRLYSIIILCVESEICKMRVFRVDLHIYELLRCLG